MIKNSNATLGEKIALNGIEYINKEMFTEDFEKEIKQQRGDWDKDSEAQDAFDVAIRIIRRM